MKVKNVAVIIGLVLGLAACKKGSNYPIVGKWQQTKLRTYTRSYSGSISHDTSYLKSSFDTSNYAQFNNDGTCVIGLFYPPGSYNPVDEVARVSTEKYNYSPAGAKYVMTVPTTLIYPSGFITTDTASVNANTVLIHSVFDNHQDYAVSDSYYTK
jgi:hypothetical protein